MVAFETFQTVPVVALRNMDPYMQIQEQGHSFPIAGEDFNFVRLDLTKALIKNPNNTFFIQLTDESMVQEGLMPGDLLIIDRTRPPRHKSIAVVYFEGEFVACRLLIMEDKLCLQFCNDEQTLIEVEPDMEFSIWGILRDVIHMDGKVLE